MINRLQEIIEQTSTSTNRIRLLKPVSQLTFIDITRLESVLENRLARQRKSND